MIKSKIKVLMQERKMTYAAIQSITGFSSQTITRIRGDMIKECRLSTLEIIAKALDVSISDLFEEVDSKE